MRERGPFYATSRIWGLVAILTLLVAGCESPEAPKPAPVSDLSAEKRILSQLTKYEDAIRHMDYDAAADLFIANGKLLNPGRPEIEGRELIRVFLKSFNGFKVIENSDQANSTVVEGKSAQQSGTYAQTVTIPEGDTVHVQGKFEAWWVLDYDGEWRLARLETTPTQ
ncbi:MAG TPA: nuclear transport factor 2 family protein [Candidatus Didemnitutus sp.]|nr:nuclear transport factor 2 family protein [Candidatus Didemnitutus sp.]